MDNIHDTAIIHDRAVLGDDVTIGAYCVVGEHVRLGDGVTLVSHVSISGHTKIGERTVIYPFTSLGHPPQDLKFRGEDSRLEIGADNVIREHVTMNPGTEGGGMLTQVGSNGLFMVGAHVAHDCQVGDYVVMANNATLAGHVHVGDNAVIGGLAAVHQFVRVGKHAMIGGMSGVEHDVIPYGSVMGERAALSGLNLIGLKRRGFDRDTIHAIRGMYKDLFEGNHASVQQRAKALLESCDNADVQEILDFVLLESKRALCVPKG